MCDNCICNLILSSGGMWNAEPSTKRARIRVSRGSFRKISARRASFIKHSNAVVFFSLPLNRQQCSTLQRLTATFRDIKQHHVISQLTKRIKRIRWEYPTISGCHNSLFSCCYRDSMVNQQQRDQVWLKNRLQAKVCHRGLEAKLTSYIHFFRQQSV